ncbi:16S rRNA (guanine(527)-N(7))-methyltransferase RsmG [Sphingomonas sp.]|uniref:16S rRNA (guanine(527)-N(7))-methyltransferase RsmG n=1 Tax=Sphingomonas sp. TaxID=28214 RepID=UPI003B3B4C2B
MTEDEAQTWLAGRSVPRETLDHVSRFIDLLTKANTEQNLIAASTLPQVWSRHITDSVQLLDHAPPLGRWVDLGSGPGFPGLMIALFGKHHVDLVESRAKRVGFLHDAITCLGLDSRVRVLSGRAEAVAATTYDVISARAFAPLPRLFEIGRRFARADTVWLLPKGRNAAAELAEAQQKWQGDFALVPSVTDADSSILIARGVAPGRSK